MHIQPNIYSILFFHSIKSILISLPPFYLTFLSASLHSSSLNTNIYSILSFYQHPSHLTFLPQTWLVVGRICWWWRERSRWTGPHSLRCKSLFVRPDGCLVHPHKPPSTPRSFYGSWPASVPSAAPSWGRTAARSPCRRRSLCCCCPGLNLKSWYQNSKNRSLCLGSRQKMMCDSQFVASLTNCRRKTSPCWGIKVRRGNIA